MPGRRRHRHCHKQEFFGHEYTSWATKMIMHGCRIRASQKFQTGDELKRATKLPGGCRSRMNLNLWYSCRRYLYSKIMPGIICGCIVVVRRPLPRLPPDCVRPTAEKRSPQLIGDSGKVGGLRRRYRVSSRNNDCRSGQQYAIAVS